jgi:hypothetical protein
LSFARLTVSFLIARALLFLNVSLSLPSHQCPGGATMAQSLGVVVFPGKKGSAGTAIANYACAICGGNQSIEIAQ